MDDERLGRSWEVWPFVWRVRVEGVEGKRVESVEEGMERAKELIRLDGEHDDVRFVRLEEARAMRTVEGLVGSLERVLEEGREEGGEWR